MSAASSATKASPAGLSRIASSVVVGLGVAVAISVFWAYSGEPVAMEAPALGDAAVIGCPLLEAEGPEPPAGWLGAMAADLACARMTWHLGGDPARTRAPAELLGLPPLAGDDFPVDPFSAPDARDRTLAAARELDGWIDGVIRLDDGRSRVVLRLHAQGGEVVAEAEGSGDALYIAVGEAVDALAAFFARTAPGAARSRDRALDRARAHEHGHPLRRARRRAPDRGGDGGAVPADRGAR
ncbi:MAG: hypothetical protein M5U28_41475 [Sandaracinaceae bacterium]|nr:hypothetical protein [Sandaracinaceae bacterium]